MEKYRNAQSKTIPKTIHQQTFIIIDVHIFAPETKTIYFDMRFLWISSDLADLTVSKMAGTGFRKEPFSWFFNPL